MNTEHGLEKGNFFVVCGSANDILANYHDLFLGCGWGVAARTTEIEYVIHSCPSGNDRSGGITIMVKAYLL